MKTKMLMLVGLICFASFAASAQDVYADFQPKRELFQLPYLRVG